MRASLCLLLLLATVGFAGHETPRKVEVSEPLAPAIQRLVERIASASSPDEAAEGYAKLFKGADRKLVSRLKRVGQTGVALRAAWEEVLLAGLTSNEKVKPEAAERFLGFVEGRLKISLPLFWEEAVKGAGLSGRKVGAGMPSTWHSPAKKKKTADGTLIYTDDNDSVLVRPALERHPLLRRAFESRTEQHFKAALNRERCVLAGYNRWGRSFPLVCFNRQTGDVIWTTTVWDSAYRRHATGVWHENVAMLLSKELIVVVGAGSHSFFIEAFNLKSGRNDFRFASWYDTDE